ncbi:hypothetical protein SAMN05421788_111131 [Filimonas lacunae]|uniref:VOC domain-containing protein n=1 Tax=Filimonas lacunae TaxID=477680 RepID=A0A173MAW4_9BACT|nr:VOC family protein [Filimonas lacunae]BAV04672.1 lactoylglutathione lyase and related lyases [Filimonas lacunae]SIT32420.1 hypothetical protein SAMN05421788_111131 [Filimonas lacunae]
MGGYIYNMLPQAISYITIGVKNLEAMKHFYMYLFGWTPMKDTPEMVFFAMNGCVLALYPVQLLAAEIGEEGMVMGKSKVTLAVNMANRQQVDTLFAAFTKKGVRILKMPETVSWGGYRGYIADTEENYWEIVWNPHIPVD